MTGPRPCAGLQRATSRVDAGFATVWVVVAMAVVIVVAGIGSALGAVTLAGHRAAAAADAAALAAALGSLDGPPAACHRAAALAAADGARLVACGLDGAISQVRVSVRLPGPLAAFGSATAAARAGPATGQPG